MPRKQHVSDHGPVANHTSTAYSKARYAHPFFLPAAPEQRQPIHGLTRMTDWSQQQLGPIPPVARGGNLNLTDVIGAAGTGTAELAPVAAIS